MFAAHRLPGIGFDVVETPVPDALPRMDIALFVGFAAMGPVHRPVPVNDYLSFLRIFGDEVPLAFDPETGSMLATALAPTVRAFFANGGTQCWIVRVARTSQLQALLGSSAPEDIASCDWFEIPGLFALHLDGSLRPAIAQARSLGSWADAVRVAGRVERTSFVHENDEILPIAPSALAAGSEPVLLQQIGFDAPVPLQRGDLLQFDDRLGTLFAAVEWSDGVKVRASLLAERPASSPPQSPPSSPPDAGIETIAFAGRCPLADAIASKVTLELRVDNGLETTSLDGIGLTRLATRSWWQFLSDDLRPADAPQPILPIAASDEDVDSGEGPIAWLPFDIGGAFGEPATARHDGRSSLERDGLSRPGAELFLDPALAGTGPGRIIEEGERILHVEERALLGIHALLGIGGTADFNPVSLIAAPDAIQRGWSLSPAAAAPQPQSDLSPPPHWFDHRGPCAVVPPAIMHAREPDRAHFLDCGTRVIATPLFAAIPTPRKPGLVELEWSDEEPGATYSLELARRADFSDAELVFEGTATSWHGTLSTDGFYFFRLQARQGDEISAPALLALTVRSSDWTALSAGDYDPGELLLIQRGLLRLACATGEVFALLSMPRHFRIREALDHARMLRSLGADFGSVAGFGGKDRRALSFGALYHPWTRLSVDKGLPAAAPPDGAVAGIHAKRTLARGAWIAAANEPLKDVVALEPKFRDDDWSAADDGRINLLRRDPRGFLLLDSDTLSDEPEWKQVNVRRLMCLLRRVALRRGATYVFEPNGDVLRRSVERGFSQLLERLFRLGAFVGEKAEEAFRLAVTTTAQDRDEGRLVVEIGVAPAQPLRFLTVRLVQAGGRFAIAEEG